MATSFSKTATHSALVEAGIVVYQSHEDYQFACMAVMQEIQDARDALTSSEFETWSTAEFGTGGNQKADGYVAGAWPTALRADGRLMQRGKKKDDETDSAANRVNTFVADVRSIVRAVVENPGFEFQTSFRATYKAARGAPPADAAPAADKTATKPGKTVVITAEMGRDWVRASPIDALNALRGLMLDRKDSIRAATLEAVATQLAEQAKEAEAKAKAEAQAARSKRSKAEATKQGEADGAKWKAA